MSDIVSLSSRTIHEEVPVAEAPGTEQDISLAHLDEQLPNSPLPEASSPAFNPFHRYHIETQTTPDIVPLPSKFRVKVKKHRLIGMVLKELIETKGDLPVALSRPCVYGVFSRLVGGLAPREELCVGCLRCTVQYPKMVKIMPNPKRQRLGDSSVKPEYVDTLMYEARTGRVPVRGAGYRGTFGGEGWDGLWTDMSEIVRPTRDGIHGREFISTAVDIGEKPAFLHFDEEGEIVGEEPKMTTLPVPFLFDMPAKAMQSKLLLEIFTEAARQIETLAMVPISSMIRFSLAGQHIVPVITPSEMSLLDQLSESPRMLMLDSWDRECYDALRSRFPYSIICVRVPMDSDILELVQQGVRVLHLTANYHGYVGDRFVMDLILAAHQRLVDAGVREEVTLIGSGGILLAEPFERFSQDRHRPPGIEDFLCRQKLDRLKPIEAELIQAEAKSRGDTLNFPVRLNGKLAALSGLIASGDGPPTAGHKAVFSELSQRVQAQLDQLSEAVVTEVGNLNEAIRATGLPAVGV